MRDTLVRGVTRRALALVSAFLLTLGLGLATASPAQAQAWHGCPEGSLCLWDWQNYNYSGGVWSIPVSDLGGAGCYNLTGKYFTSGYTVYDRATSFTWNNPNAADEGIFVEFDAWVNCNSGGGAFAIDYDSVWNVYNLTYAPWGNYNDTIASIKVSCCRP